MSEFPNIARQEDRSTSPADDHSFYFQPVTRLESLKLSDISLK